MVTYVRRLLCRFNLHEFGLAIDECERVVCGLPVHRYSEAGFCIGCRRPRTT